MGIKRTDTETEASFNGKCARCEQTSRKWTQLPNCPRCNEPLGCARAFCRGNGMVVICGQCEYHFNTWDYWRQFAKPYRGDTRDPIGLVRYAPNGLPVVNEGDGWYRPIRINLIPAGRKLHTENGAYLTADGTLPLFPGDWEIQ